MAHVSPRLASMSRCRLCVVLILPAGVMLRTYVFPVSLSVYRRRFLKEVGLEITRLGPRCISGSGSHPLGRHDFPDAWGVPLDRSAWTFEFPLICPFLECIETRFAGASLALPTRVSFLRALAPSRRDGVVGVGAHSPSSSTATLSCALLSSLLTLVLTLFFCEVTLGGQLFSKCKFSSAAASLCPEARETLAEQKGSCQLDASFWRHAANRIGSAGYHPQYPNRCQ